MKPLKNGLNFANWLMRISLLTIVIVCFWKSASTFEFSSKLFLVSISFILFALLLFIGGFMSKPGLTVISGIILFGLSVYKIVLQFSGDLSNLVATFFIMASVSLYFACAGNNA